MPTLCMYPKELKTYLCKDLYKIAYSSSFIVSQNWKQSQCLGDKWMNTMVTPPVEYSSEGKGRKESKKKERSTDNAKTSMNLTDIAPRERSKTWKHTHCMILFIWSLRTGKIKLWWQNPVVAAEALAFCANENVPCLGWGSGYTGIHTCQILLKWTSVCFIIENEERGDNQAEQSELMTQKRVNAGNWRTLNIHILYIWAILVNFEKIFYPGKKRSKLHGK